MDNERKAGAGRAVEQAAEDIDRRGSDEDTIFEQARDTGHAVGGAGPEMARHIAQENPRTGMGGEDGMEESDNSMDEDDEDEDDELDELDEDEDADAGVEAMDEDDDEDRGLPGYGDRGNTPV